MSSSTSSLFDEIRQKTAFVVEHAIDVKINDTKLEEVAQNLPKNVPSQEDIFLSRIKELSLEEELQLRLACCLSNARYWREPKWETETLGGALLLIDRYHRAMAEGKLWSKDLSKDDYWQIVDLGNGIELPRWKERYGILAAGICELEENFGGSVLNLFETGKYNAEKIARLLLKHFPNFRDISQYQGEEIPFCKLLQLTLSSFQAILVRRGHKGLDGIEKLTAMADYKIPQVLRDMGVLEYSPELAQKVDSKTLLSSGSTEEVEIRATMVQAVEKLSAHLNQLPQDVDHLLWLTAQNRDMAPYHRTDTLFY